MQSQPQNVRRKLNALVHEGTDSYTEKRVETSHTISSMHLAANYQFLSLVISTINKAIQMVILCGCVCF